MASCLLSQQLPDKAREALMKGLILWLPSCSEKREQKEEEGEKEEEEEKTEQVQLRANVGIFKRGQSFIQKVVVTLQMSDKCYCCTLH